MKKKYCYYKHFKVWYLFKIEEGVVQLIAYLDTNL